MDNGDSTNKNRYMFAWTIDAVQSCSLDSTHVAFMVAGHTKFDPDRMFSTIANGYNHSDIFNIDELCSLCQLYTNATVLDGSIVYPWRDYLKEKYTDLPGTRKYHGFLTTSNHRGKVTVKAHEVAQSVNFLLHLSSGDQQSLLEVIEDYFTTPCETVMTT